MAPASFFLLVATTAVIVYGQASVSSPGLLQPIPTLQTSFFPVPKATGLPSVPASDSAALPPAAPGVPGGVQPGPPAAGSKPEEGGAHGLPGGIGAAGTPGGPGGPGGAGKAAHSPFMYSPSFSIAVAAAMVFVISCTTTTVQIFHNKTWYFLLLLQAALADVVAAVARCYSILNTKSMVAFAIQMMGFKIAPSLLAISIIFTFTRIIWWVTPNEKRTRKVLLFPVHKVSFFWTIFFAVPDMAKGILSQLSRPGPGKRPNPTSVFNRIQQICLTAQFFVMVLWTLWAARLMRISRKWVISGEAEDKNWRALGLACIASSTILSWQILYSIIEFDAQYDPKAFISTHEWVYWLADIIPILVIYTIFNFYHPGEFLPREMIGFKLNTKAIEKSKVEHAWPLTISNPIPRPDEKEIEVVTTEIHPHPGSRV